MVLFSDINLFADNANLGAWEIGESFYFTQTLARLPTSTYHRRIFVSLDVIYPTVN